MKFFKGAWEVTKIVGAVLICAVFIRSFLIQPFVVEGASMEPNYHNNEYLLIEKVTYHLHTIKHSDVIVFKYPNDTRVNYIKRVIGVPGDTVKIEDNQVFVNGQLLNESYLPAGTRTEVASSPEIPYEVTLGTKQYFVMGDNREHSSDSRNGWLLDNKYIIGRSALVLYSNSTATATN